MSETSPRPVWIGLLPVLLGGLLCAVAAGLIPTDEEKRHVPAWVLFLCGVIFVAGGAATLAGPQSRIANVLAALIVLGLGTIGLWVAVAGDAAKMPGGLPFISRESNALAARVLFGMGGAACFLFAGAIALQRWKRRRAK